MPQRIDHPTPRQEPSAVAPTPRRRKQKSKEVAAPKGGEDLLEAALYAGVALPCGLVSVNMLLNPESSYWPNFLSPTLKFPFTLAAGFLGVALAGSAWRAMKRCRGNLG
jgi:hypothetical protein